MVEGVKIPFERDPVQVRQPFPFRLGLEEKEVMSGEVLKLEQKGVIERVYPEEGQFVSNVFLRPKATGGFRLILDLTELNKFIEYEHFKMTSLQTALDMVREGAWMGSVDLKDAYYSVGIDWSYRKFLRFYWQGQLFQFVGMPNGLACAPRIFTKLLVPVFAELRVEGRECFPYIDDSFVIANDWAGCRETLHQLCQGLDKLGMVIHLEKSVLEPTQQLTFLGFVIDSVGLTVTLTQDKKDKFVRAASQVLEKDWLTIREVAGLIGLMVAYQVAVQYGGAHLKGLEREKNEALAKERGNFDGFMRISARGRRDIDWWLLAVGAAQKKIRLETPEVEICTDASLEGWGAHRGDIAIGGRWLEEEAEEHINMLELKAILFGLKSLCGREDEQVKVLTDSITALAYVKHMGGVKSAKCDEVAKQIWDWLESNEMWVTIAHIPGSLNVTADFKSRNFQDNIEWELDDKLFARVCKTFEVPDVDLFASRLTKKVEVYVSWNPDPEAWKIDAFSFKWTNALFYIFPPFSLVGKVLRKILGDKARAILVVPDWPGQPWYGRLQAVAKRKLRIRSRKGNLWNRGKPDNEEFVSKCPLGVYLLSGISC